MTTHIKHNTAICFSPWFCFQTQCYQKKLTIYFFLSLLLQRWKCQHCQASTWDRTGAALPGLTQAVWWKRQIPRGKTWLKHQPHQPGELVLLLKEKTLQLLVMPCSSSSSSSGSKSRYQLCDSLKPFYPMFVMMSRIEASATFSLVCFIVY